MSPIILNEHQVHRFNFYLDGEIHQGIQHNNLLYGLAHIFNDKERLKAYELANSLTEANLRSIVTVSTRYHVWIQLSVASYAHWQECIAKRNEKAALNQQKPQPVKQRSLGWNYSHLFQANPFAEALA
ncbi:MAG: hypothetical protein NW224_18495 [Leptolyngbyaceae cyanobacterium bins.302]|nr:hypothetical protein [Leptolyngbyaceae cyanobacterium bins.302]